MMGRVLRRIRGTRSPHQLDAISQRRVALVTLAAYFVAPFRWIEFRLRKGTITRLHVGCGTVKLQGWINADIDPRAELILDVRLPMPFGSDRFDRIYAEHMLEHLSPDHALQFLREARRVLKPAGVMRIAMPDLERLVSGYGGEWKTFDWVAQPGFSFIETPAEMLNIAFRWWGHKWLYDARELKRMLERAGFADVTFVANGQSEHVDLRGLETRPDSTLVAEVAK